MRGVHLETMTSRERVVRTLQRLPVDRYPIDLGSHFSTGISAFAYWRLREHLGLSTDDIWAPDVVQMLAHVDDDVLARFHGDCTLLWPRWQREQRWQPWGPYQFQMPAAMPLQQTPDGGWAVSQGERHMRLPAQGYFFDGDWISDWREADEAAVLAATARPGGAHLQRDALRDQLYGLWRLLWRHRGGGAHVDDAR